MRHAHASILLLSALLACGEPAATLLPQRPPGELNPRDGLRYVRVPAGEFEQGCQEGDPDCRDWERPRHTVRITRELWFGRTEVPVAAYRRFADETGRELGEGPVFNSDWSKLDHPIVRVGWKQAAAYCTWAGGRLPTEAEWEYAARAGRTAALYPWGDEIDRSRANYGTEECCSGVAEGADRWEHTSPIESFPANDWRLHDVSGNVWEWVADWHADGYYAQADEADPQGPETGETHGVRGGAWDDAPWALRISNRNRAHRPDWRYPHVGFRCVLDEAP